MVIIGCYPLVRPTNLYMRLYLSVAGHVIFSPTSQIKGALQIPWPLNNGREIGPTYIYFLCFVYFFYYYYFIFTMTTKLEVCLCYFGLSVYIWIYGKKWRTCLVFQNIAVNFLRPKAFISYQEKKKKFLLISWPPKPSNWLEISHGCNKSRSFISMRAFWINQPSALLHQFLSTHELLYIYNYSALNGL